VHELRIRTRRLLAHLEVLSRLSPRDGSTDARRRLKRFLEATGPARDAHVQLRLFERLFPKNVDPAGRVFHRRLKERERRLTRKLARKLQRHAAKLRQFKPRRLFRPLQESGGQLALARREALQRAIQRVLEREQADNADRVRRRHRLRVAVKKLRYLVEILPPAPAATADPLREMQASLGEWHDFDLLVERLRRFASRHPATGHWLETQSASLRRYERTLQPSLRPNLGDIRSIETLES
jgi:CHAD domain-containing protein